MIALHFDPRPMDQLDAVPRESTVDWLWHGYLARGNITLLTSQWKAGKTTLLAGLLRAMAGGTFLDRPCAAAAALVVSEESPAHWAQRRRAIPIGPHARLVSRPFPRRPTPGEWDELVANAERFRAEEKLDLLVVDPLATFLPGRSESDPGTLLEMLHPLRRLAEAGVAVLVLHHPRKKPADEGSTARGSGALLGFVDVILELTRYGALAPDSTRRKLIGLSRYPETPRTLVYQWVPGTPEFSVVQDVLAVRFREHWETVRGILAGRKTPATHRELLADWPADRVAPATGQLYEWLSRAFREKLVDRLGAGTQLEPYRFRLPRPVDGDSPLGKLPPLGPLPRLR